MAKDGQTEAHELRQALLELAAKQIELRAFLEAYRARSHETINIVANKATISWQSLKRFIDGAQVLSSGRGLAGLCELLQCQDLGAEIAMLAGRVGERYLRLASQPPEVIGTALDLTEYYYDRSELYTMAEFAAVFGADEPVVLGVLNRNLEAIAVLGDEQTRERLTQVLIDNHLDEQLEAAKKRLEAERREAGERLRRLVEALAAQVGGVGKLAKMLDTPRNSLYYATTGQASLRRIQDLIGAAEKLAAMVGSPSPVGAQAPVPEAASAPESEPEEETGLGSGIPAELEELGGITTASGIKHVLTAESFRQIETVALVDLRDMLVKFIERLRLALNYASQLQDEQARLILVDGVAAQLRELDRAIRIFTFKGDPGQLLLVYDSERALQEAQGQMGQSTRKGKK